MLMLLLSIKKLINYCSAHHKSRSFIVRWNAKFFFSPFRLLEHRSIFLFIHKTIFWSSFLHLRLFALSRFQAPHMDRCFPFHFIVVVVDGNKMLLAYVSKSSSLNSWGSLLSELLYGKTEYYVLIIAAFLPSFTQLFLYLLHNNILLSIYCALPS